MIEPRYRRSTSLALCAIAVLAQVWFTAAARGFTFYVWDGQKITWASSESVRYASPSTFPPGSVAELHLLEAMALWNIVPGTSFEYFFEPLDQDFPIDHTDGFNDTAAVPASELDPGVIGVTFLVNNGAQWFDMDILFSDNPGGVGYNFDPNPDCDVLENPAPDHGFNFLLTAVHELGHALGLGHDPQGNEGPGASWFVANMNPIYPTGGPLGQENIVELHTDDRNGLRFLYPPSGTSGPRLIDLALGNFAPTTSPGLAAPLGLSPEIVGPGGEVIADSVIENLGLTNELSVRQGFYLSTDPLIGTEDTFLGSLLWDIAVADVLQFGVSVDMPADFAPGQYFLGSILDDVGFIPEEYEDNNAVSYCEPLTISQLAPNFDPWAQQVISCDQSLQLPAPNVSHPLNMAPITWSLENAPPGMTIEPATGAVSWADPLPSPFLYVINVRATNGAGSLAQALFVGVQAGVPVITQIADDYAVCSGGYVGPAPVLSDPDCMEPIINWSLDAGPPGMTVQHDTGVVSWDAPLLGTQSHVVTVRASNAVGNGTVTWQVTVVSGDANGDGTLGLVDLPEALGCLGGPGAELSGTCGCADLTGNDRVDLHDFAVWQRRFGS